VEIDDGVYAGVFVVTEVKKSLLQQSLFHLCALNKDEFWIRLRRNNKSGKAFRPLRRVVKVNFKSPASPASPASESDASPASRPVSTANKPAASPGKPLDADEQEAEEYALILNEYAGDDDN